MSDNISTETTKTIILNSINTIEWEHSLRSEMYRLNNAGQALKLRKKYAVPCPTVTDLIKGTTIEKYDQDISGRLTEHGLKDFRKDMLNYEDVKIPAFRKEQIDLITFLYSRMSTTSFGKMTSMLGYALADFNVDSFDIFGCISESHNDITSINIVCHRVKTAVNVKQTGALQIYITAHKQAMDGIRYSLESKDPMYKGYISIDLLTSIWLLNGLDIKQWASFMDRQMDKPMQHLIYEDTVQILQKYAASREQMTDFAVDIPRSINDIPNNLAMSSTISPILKPSAEETITCKQCRQPFPKLFKRSEPTQYFDTCRLCNDKNKKERD
jgi:hypothetical protein